MRAGGRGTKTSSEESNNGFTEKQPQMTYDPDLAHPAAGYSDAAHFQPTSNVNERKLVAKIDLRVVPVLSVLYLLAFLDRTNIGNANIFGLSTELKLHGNQYNTALTIFFGKSSCLSCRRSTNFDSTIYPLRSSLQHHFEAFESPCLAINMHVYVRIGYSLSGIGP